MKSRPKPSPCSPTGGRSAGACDAYPEQAAGVGAFPGDAGVDYAIGEPTCVGRGLGTRIVGLLVEHTATRHPGGGIIADPEATNVASRRVLERNGFVLIAERPVPSEPTTSLVAIYRHPGVRTESAHA